jgi:hypothetical protein
MAKQLSELELGGIISNQIRLAKDHDRSERATPREKALDYYLGHMDKYVPPEPNRSKVVSRDVADTMGWLMPDIMRVFTASGRMAEAQPVGPEDKAYADEATDGMNYVFWKDNKGYEIVYAASWDALLIGNGIVKTYYDDTPVYTTSFHDGLTEDQVALLLQDEDVEVLARTDTTEVVGYDEMSQPIEAVLTEIKIKRKKADGRFVIDVIPPEDFLIDADAICTDEAAFTAHWQRLTRSALVAMGYDKEEVWAIPEAGRADTAEAIARDDDRDGESTDASMQLVDYYECFIRVDADGDGEAELVRACYAGGEKGNMLDWEVWEDEHPFDDIPCEPIPHRWDARSIADETIDIQDVKTVLTRQLLNNTYWVNNPQRFAQGKIKNPDQLENPEFGGTVFGDIGSIITDLPVPYIGDKALQGIGYMDEVAQRRTGIGRQSMALDPEVLQNQTATASNNNRDAAHSQSELIARNMAEWGWKKVFRKLMRLMIKHQKQPRQLMMNSKREVRIDPRFWNADMDVTVNVGLGTGSRERDLVMLGRILQTQLMMADRFQASGAMEDAIDLLPKILQTMVKMAEAAGIRNPEDFYPDYTEEKVAQLKALAAEKAQQPNPEVVKEQAKAQSQMQMKQMDVQAQGEKERLQAEYNNAEKEMAARYQLELDALKAQYADAASQREYQFKYTELAQKREIELLKLGMVEKETGEGGGRVTVDSNTDAIMQTMQQFGNTLATLAASMNAPTEIVRDPVTGKAVGSRKVMN